MNVTNSSIDLISILLILYLLKYLLFHFVSLFQARREIIGTISSKRNGFLNLFHWVTIENDGMRIELNVGKNYVGLMSEGDRLRVNYKGSRIYQFYVIKSKFSEVN